MAENDNNKPVANGKADDKVIEGWKLLTPISGYGEELTEIKLRRPTGMDLLNIGNPVMIDMQTGNLVFDAPKMTAMIAQLIGVPESAVRNMDTRDWSTAAWKVAPFFLPRTL
jgi:hypothetical protein